MKRILKLIKIFHEKVLKIETLDDEEETRKIALLKLSCFGVLGSATTQLTHYWNVKQ